MGFFLDIWSSIPSKVRVLIALAILLIGGYQTYQGFLGHRAIKEQAHGNREIAYDRPGSDGQMFIGMGVTAVGIILLTLSGKSDSEKSGYTSI